MKHPSLQLKIGLSYIAVIAAVLLLLNTYPLLASQDLLFNSELDALKNQTRVMSSALMELENLNRKIENTEIRTLNEEISAMTEKILKEVKKQDMDAAENPFLP